jgi:hypothetical protein
MDFCRNVSVSGEYQQEQVLSPPCSKLGGLSTSLDDLFSAQNTVSLFFLWHFYSQFLLFAFYSLKFHYIDFSSGTNFFCFSIFCSSLCLLSFILLYLLLLCVAASCSILLKFHTHNRNDHITFHQYPAYTHMGLTDFGFFFFFFFG